MWRRHRFRSPEARLRPSSSPARELADCAHAVAQRDGDRVFAYGPGGATARSGSGSRSGTAFRPGRSSSRSVACKASSSTRLSSSHARPRARRGAELRPSAQDPRSRGGRDRSVGVGRRGARPGRARRRAREPRREGVVPLRSPRSRTRAEGRSRQSGARGSSRSCGSTGSPSSRTTRTGSSAEERPRISLLELEGGDLVTYTSSFSNRCPRRTQRLLRASGGARAGLRGTGGFHVHLAAIPPAGRRRGVHRARQLRAEPRARPLRAAGPTRRDAPALDANAPDGVSWSHPAGGYFVWLELDGADATALAADTEQEGVTFVPGPGFFAAGSVE